MVYINKLAFSTIIGIVINGQLHIGIASCCIFCGGHLGCWLIFGYLFAVCDIQIPSSHSACCYFLVSKKQLHGFSGRRRRFLQEMDTSVFSIDFFWRWSQSSSNLAMIEDIRDIPEMIVRYPVLIR